jgi:DoxX-like family
MEATLTHPVESTSARPASNKRRWTGIVMSALPILFLTWDSVAKLMKIQPVIEATQRLGYPDSTTRPLGIVLLACVALYAFRRTAVLGAVLLTAYLGGAIATHVRVADPLFSHTLFPIYVAALVWGGLYLRDSRLGVIAPWRR